MRHFLIKPLLFLLMVFLGLNLSFAQGKEEKEEKTYEVKKLRKAPPGYELYSTAGVFTGFDSNANLDGERKGDVFEEFLYSLAFAKKFTDGLKFTFDYDLDTLNYNEYTDVSSITNHMRFGLANKSSPLTLGTGYDLSIFYFTHDSESNFLLHKAFAFLRHDISRKTYQKIEFTGGYKDFTEEKAMGDTAGSLQDKDRLDRRLEAEYRIVSKLSPRLQAGFRFRFTRNDSNARFQDYYDYKSYAQTLSAEYRLTSVVELFSDFTYTRKNYKTRATLDGTSKERDNLYITDAGIRYKLNRDNLISLYYTYRDNGSNEDTERYCENMVTCGWQYYF